MAALSAFYPYVVPIAPGIPNFAIDRALVDAAIDFCRRSFVWQETLDPIPLVDGEAGYELYPMEGEIVAALEVRITREPGGRSIDLARALAAEVALNAEQGTPTVYAHRHPNLLDLAPIPMDAGQVHVRVALEPKAGASRLDDSLYGDWREAIGAGAAARILLTYGDPNQAAVARGAFNDGINRASAHALVTRSRGRLRTRGYD